MSRIKAQSWSHEGRREPTWAFLPGKFGLSFSASVKWWSEELVKYETREQSDRPYSVCGPAASFPGNLAQVSGHCATTMRLLGNKVIR